MHQGTELERVTWELGLLKEMAELVSSSLDTTGVLQQAAERLGAAFGAEPVLIRLRTGAGLEARIVAAVGVPAEAADRSYNENPELWPAGRVIRDGLPIRVDRIHDQPFTETDAYRANPWGSSVTVPIRAGDEVLGALTVGSNEPRRFGDIEERMLTTIGRQIGVAVANGRLFERVRRAKDEWVRTFDTIGDPLALCDAKGRLLRVNAALASLCGKTPAELVGRPCAETGLCGDSAEDCLVNEALRAQKRVSRELVRPDGRIFAGTALPVSAASGEVVIVAHEVTEDHARAERLRELSQELQIANRELRSTVDRLRTTQEQVVQAGKLSALGQLVAGVAHELNNPLTSVMGYAQLVQQQVARRPELARRSKDLLQDVTHIMTEADRAARIVRNLLLFARRQSVARAHHDLAFLCDQVLELRAYDLRVNGIEITTSFAAGSQADLRRRVADSAGAAEPRAECRAGDGPATGAPARGDRDVRAGVRVAPARDARHRPRDRARESRARLRSVLHDARRGRGHRSRSQHRVRHRARPRRRDLGREPARGGHVVFRPAADLGGHRGTARAARSSRSGDSGLARLPRRGAVGWGCQVRPARNLREALESLAEDDPALVIVDRVVVEPDPARWQDAWRRRDGRSVMIAAYSNAPDDPDGTLSARGGSRGAASLGRSLPVASRGRRRLPGGAPAGGARPACRQSLGAAAIVGPLTCFAPRNTLE